MSDPMTLLTLSVTGLSALAVGSLAALKGWQGWLEIKRIELAGRHASSDQPASPASRIELADLKERVRKLEGIAAGVDL